MKRAKYIIGDVLLVLIPVLAFIFVRDALSAMNQVEVLNDRVSALEVQLKDARASIAVLELRSIRADVNEGVGR